MQKQSKKVRAPKCENKPISVSFNSPRRKKRQYSRVEWPWSSLCLPLVTSSCIAPPVQLPLQLTTFRGEALKSHASSGLMKSVQSESRFHTASGGRCFDAFFHARALLSRRFWWWWRNNVEVSFFSFPQ